jgi:hypothetical protein
MCLILKMKRSEIINHELVDMLTKIIPDITSNKELEALGRQFLGKEFSGVFSSDTVPKDSGLYIVNLDPADKPGTHWVGLYQSPKSRVVYDSFGRKDLLQFEAKYTEPDKEQLEVSNNCGARSLAWLILVKHWGIAMGMQI